MLIWENINILKNHKTFAHLIKGTVLGRTSWGADTFPTRNRLPEPNSGFSQTLLFFMVFHISYNNYGGDSKLYFYKFLFLVRRPVAISVVTLWYLLSYLFPQNLMWWILNPIWNLQKILTRSVTSHTMQWITIIFLGSLDSHRSTLSQKSLIIWRDGTWLSSKGYASTSP